MRLLGSAHWHCCVCLGGRATGHPAANKISPPSEHRTARSGQPLPASSATLYVLTATGMHASGRPIHLNMRSHHWSRMWVCWACCVTYLLCSERRISYAKCRGRRTRELRRAEYGFILGEWRSGLPGVSRGCHIGTVAHLRRAIVL